MKKEEQTIRSGMKPDGKDRQHLRRGHKAEERAAELPAKEAAVAAEMKNRKK